MMVISFVSTDVIVVSVHLLVLFIFPCIDVIVQFVPCFIDVFYHHTSPHIFPCITYFET